MSINIKIEKKAGYSAKWYFKISNDHYIHGYSIKEILSPAINKRDTWKFITKGKEYNIRYIYLENDYYIIEFVENHVPTNANIDKFFSDTFDKLYDFFNELIELYELSKAIKIYEEGSK
ncbi:MAG: hypothetical protein GXO75_08420 [Calditrichaeota bacterium]|nr:hypothetical protein [Calditrichota bacterium]